MKKESSRCFFLKCKLKRFSCIVSDWNCIEKIWLVLHLNFQGYVRLLHSVFPIFIIFLASSILTNQLGDKCSCNALADVFMVLNRQTHPRLMVSGKKLFAYCNKSLLDDVATIVFFRRVRPECVRRNAVNWLICNGFSTARSFCLVHHVELTCRPENFSLIAHNLH